MVLNFLSVINEIRTFSSAIAVGFSIHFLELVMSGMEFDLPELTNADVCRYELFHSGD